MRWKCKLKTTIVIILALFIYGIMHKTVINYEKEPSKDGFFKGNASPTHVNARQQPRVHTGRISPLTVPKIDTYCNTHPSRDMGNEGLVAMYYKLLSAYVVLTPGYSSPIGRLANIANLSCLINTSQRFHLPEVDGYVRIMATASQKSPRDPRFSRWALYPNHVTCSGGQLTSVGAVQSIVTGMHFSERYYHIHKLFNTTNWHAKVSAQTIQSSRTFQSAIAFLYGFIPSFDYGNINLIASNRLDFCQNGLYGSHCACVGIEALRNKAIRECRLDQHYLDLLKKYKDIIEHIKTVLNVHEYKLLDLSDLLDVLNSYDYQNTPWPCNSQGLCIAATSLKPLLALVDYQRHCLASNHNYKRFAKVTMHGLLNKITQEMNFMINGKSDSAFQLYSGHPAMLLQLLAALKLRDISWSGYASRVVFELYQNRHTQGHFIRVLQNGQTVTAQLGQCANNTDDGFCNFSYFHHQISEYFHDHKYCNHAELSRRL